MTVNLAIPPELAPLVRAIQVHEDGSIAIYYANPMSVGAVMADGHTFLGGPMTGACEIRVNQVLMIEANRRSSRLGAFAEQHDRQLEREARAITGIAERMAALAPALPPIPGYRDPRPPPPQGIAIPRALEQALGPVVEAAQIAGDSEDGSVQRFRLLEPYPPAAPSSAPTPFLCTSCGHAEGFHLRSCRLCLTCGSADRENCQCR